MKKLVAILALSLCSVSAFAWGHGGYRGGYHGYGWGGWVAPALVGGVIAYELSRPPVYTSPVYVNPPLVVQQPQPVVIQGQNCSPWIETKNPDGTTTTSRTCN